jgi:hypothetical protein
VLPYLARCTTPADTRKGLKSCRSEPRDLRYTGPGPGGKGATSRRWPGGKGTTLVVPWPRRQDASCRRTPRRLGRNGADRQPRIVLRRRGALWSAGAMLPLSAQAAREPNSPYIRFFSWGAAASDLLKNHWSCRCRRRCKNASQSATSSALAEVGEHLYGAPEKTTGRMAPTMRRGGGRRYSKQNRG